MMKIIQGIKKIILLLILVAPLIGASEQTLASAEGSGKGWQFATVTTNPNKTTFNRISNNQTMVSALAPTQLPLTISKPQKVLSPDEYTIEVTAYDQSNFASIVFVNTLSSSRFTSLLDAQKEPEKLLCELPVNLSYMALNTQEPITETQDTTVSVASDMINVRDVAMDSVTDAASNQSSNLTVHQYVSGGTIHPNSTVAYTVTVTNTGDEKTTATIKEVFPSNISSLSCYGPGTGITAGSLDVNTPIARNGSVTYKCTGFAREEICVDPSVTFNISVTDNSTQETIQNEMKSTVECVSSVQIKKTANTTDAKLGDDVIYTYQIFNDGNLTITDLNVQDALFGNISLPTQFLPANTTHRVEILHTIQEEISVLEHTVTVTGTTSTGDVQDTDGHTMNVAGTPKLALGVTSSQKSARVNETVTYTYRLHNTGDVAINNLKVVDSFATTIPNLPTTLLAGQIIEGELYHKIASNDLGSALVRTITAEGQASTGETVYQESNAVVQPIFVDVQLEQSVSQSTVVTNEPISYTISLHNKGNVTASDLLFTQSLPKDFALDLVRSDGTIIEDAGSSLPLLLLNIADIEPNKTVEFSIEGRIVTDTPSNLYETMATITTKNDAFLNNNQVKTDLSVRPPTTVTILDTIVNEDDKNAWVTVQLSAPATTDIWVTYDIVSGKAKEADYGASAGSLSIPTGKTTGIIHLPITDDTKAEGPEDFSILLKSASNSLILDDTALVTIIDDELDLDEISIQTNKIPEPTEIPPTATPTIVPTATTVPTAIPTETPAPTAVPTETVAPAAALTAKPTVVPQPTARKIYPMISIEDMIVNEADGTATVKVSLSESFNDTVTFDYVTVNNTADANDYTMVKGSIDIPKGYIGVFITVKLTDDVEKELNETFTIVLSNPINGMLPEDKDSATVTILDNDEHGNAPTISILDTTVNENDEKISVTVALSTISEKDVTVNYATADDTTTAADYKGTYGELTIPAGDTSGTIEIILTDDEDAEADETLHVILQNPTNAIILDGRADIVIVDNE